MAAILLRDINVAGDARDILIDGGIIRRIEPAGSSRMWDLAGDFDTMDCSGKVAVPGFINMHTHSSMTLFRGIGEDIGFQEWLDRIWTLEKKLDKDFIYWGTMVACIEMMRTGTTTFNDNYWYQPESIKAAGRMGLRTVASYICLDHGDREESARQKDQCERMFAETAPLLKDGSSFCMSVHAIYSVSEELILWASGFARSHGVNLHMHLSETRQEVEDCKRLHGGLTPVEYMEELGVLGPDLVAAHTLWLTEHDIELLGSRKVNCVHNINSNTKLASGYRFPYKELHDAGANVCLGTDGCASSNNLDMLEAMNNAAMFQKAWRDDPSAMPLNELLDMATVNGARALKLNAGVIEEGRIADINIIDTDNTFFLSDGPFLANLIYSAHSDCIDSVICNGRFVMRHREIEGEKEILAEARRALSKFNSK